MQLGETFEGELEIRQVIYTAPDGEFAVLAADDPADGGEVVLAGAIAHLDAGARTRVHGTWVEHPRYGPQLEVAEAHELDPADRAGAREYLETIRRIGRKRAELLLERHGEEVFAAIDADPEAAFASLPRVSSRQAREAAESWMERRAIRELYVALAPHGIGRLAPALAEAYGAEARRIVRTDPFRLTEMHGVGFPTADRIARAEGIPEDSPRRHEAAILHLLAEAEAEGHTHLPLAELRERAERLVGGLDPGRIEALAERELCVVEGDRVWRAETHATEQRLASALAALAGSGPAHEVAVPEQPEGGLSEEQWAAVRSAFTARLSLITGGPGTGKSTLVREIVRRAAAERLGVALCAPTGRAARRLEEAAGRGACTIHRLLEWVPGEGPMRDADDPLRAELVIVDEASMLNLQVAAVLLEAIGSRTHLVLVGDADQLPPVGAGKPFSELVDSGLVTTCRLTHVFRQAARSMIVSAAHAINGGHVPSLQPGPEQRRDFFFLTERDGAKAGALIVDLAARRLPEHFELDPVRDVQVLAPIYRGPAGVDSLNRALAERLNPTGERVLDGALRIGDKLIQKRNDYETGLMNGQIVRLLADDPIREEVQLETDEGPVRVPYASTEALRPAYAISVHKSQGAEVPLVILALHRSHAVLLSRNLVYTAVTRARRACVVVGDPWALERAVSRADSRRRHSRISEWIGLAGMAR